MKKNNSDTSAIVATIQSFVNDHQESGTLQDVAQQLNEIVSKTREATEVVVTSAVALNDTELDRLQRIVRQMVKRDLPIIQRVDQSLIGGYTIRIHDWFFDASIISHVRDMKRRLLA